VDLDFSDGERLELSKIITLAEYKRKNGELSECLRLLDSYWPRFLMAHVPATQPLATRPPRAAELLPEAEEPIRAGWMDRMKRAIWWR
ncbi:MAG TPA: hypothetical protein VHZ24_15635, partial [Pirellulales bacterium]|nr:hypothetical protein [Pirellulales bacterium]